MKHRPSWEANRSSNSRDIPCILWNLIPKRPPPVPILSQSNPLISTYCVLPKDESNSDTLCNVSYHVKFFCSEDLLAPHPTPRLEGTPCRLTATSYSIYSQLSSMSGDPSSFCSQRSHHAVVTGTHLTRTSTNSIFIFSSKENSLKHCLFLARCVWKECNKLIIPKQKLLDGVINVHKVSRFLLPTLKFYFII
jgi:hypothetical protein